MTNEESSIDLLATASPSQLTVEIEGREPIIVVPEFDSLAEGLCAAIAVRCPELGCVTVEDVVKCVQVLAINTSTPYIKIRFVPLPG
jgi:hypothetical protein